MSDEKFALPAPDTRSYKLWIGFLSFLMERFFYMDFHGEKNLPARGPGILVANHQSYLDVPLLGYFLKLKGQIFNTYWVIGKNTTRNSPLQMIIRTAPLIIVNGTVRKAEKALKENRWIVIFPEGYYAWHRVRYRKLGKEHELKRIIGNSAAILGLKTGCPIIPVGIQGTEKSMPPYAWWPKPGPLNLVIGKPFSFAPPEPEQVSEALISEKTELIMKKIEALTG